jgi:hypothetical protein
VGRIGAARRITAVSRGTTVALLSADRPRDATTPTMSEQHEPRLAALVYEAAPDIEDRRWIPARRPPTVGVAVPVA